MNKKSKCLNFLPLQELTAITPLDGRYRNRSNELSEFVSEYSLIKTRIEIESKYLLALAGVKLIRPLSVKEKARLVSFGNEML